MNTQDLSRYVIRVHKENSSFLYFTLEANENICFYSTMEESLKSPYRDIEIFVTKSLEPNFKQIIDSLKKMFNLEIL